MTNPFRPFFDRFTNPVPTTQTTDWLPGHSRDVLATYDSACAGLAGTAAAHDIEPDPVALACLLVTVTGVARQTVAKAFEASKREMDRLRAARGANVELDLEKRRAELAAAELDRRAAEDALAPVDQPGSGWLTFAGQWVGAAVVSAITGVPLGATLDVAGLHFTAVDVPAYTFIPYGVGGVFGLAVGLGFMEWGSRLESTREIVKGALWFVCGADGPSRADACGSSVDGQLRRRGQRAVQRGCAHDGGADMRALPREARGRPPHGEGGLAGGALSVQPEGPGACERRQAGHQGRGRSQGLRTGLSRV